MPLGHHARAAGRVAVDHPVGVGERGTGVVASLAAVTMFLGFLLFAVQLMLGLHARSVVTANGYDAARRVASTPTAPSTGRVLGSGRAESETRLRQALGDLGDTAEIDWIGSDTDAIRLHVKVTTPVVLPGTRAFGLGIVDRRFVVRVERER